MVWIKLLNNKKVWTNKRFKPYLQVLDKLDNLCIIKDWNNITPTYDEITENFTDDEIKLLKNYALITKEIDKIKIDLKIR